MNDQFKQILLCFILLLSIFYSVFTVVIWNGNEGTQKTTSYQSRYRENTSERTQTYAYYNMTETISERTLRFLPNFKNPCWREILGNNVCTVCLPYYFLVGVEKCGTSDLHRRLLKHPLISQNVKKETHWLARLRFTTEGMQSLSAYLELFQDAVQKDITVIQQNGYYNSIFGDASVSTLWDNRYLLSNVFTANMTTPPYTNANVVYSLNPRTKIIVILRNPITRLYSSYLFFYKNTSIVDFHRRVDTSVQIHNKCLKSNSLRYCAYFVHGQIRLHIGLYYIYIEDYLRVFPRQQIKVLRLENFTRNIAGTMEEVFNFLEVGVPSEHIMQKITAQEKTNTNTRRLRIVGKMFPRTWTTLYNFYKPYNDRLVELLGNEYNYN
ncbi:carbohydrate sulfotransferase 15-like isoform X2 [Mercenaria mercenaria]|uniref:carbohydrate sulfotransferase 15-like isoform X2 n=1 Tax=Mercenaria mercenaria TaxID=6596 RepID=UPI00234F11B5|nr:carbohydrate sulfotransferase 15-like isoform X2 [Mercenaria mercenaria]